MPNLPTPVDPQSLDTVTGGTAALATASSRCAGSDPLLQTLTGLQSTSRTSATTTAAAD